LVILDEPVREDVASDSDLSSSLSLSIRSINSSSRRPSQFPQSEQLSRFSDADPKSLKLEVMD